MTRWYGAIEAGGTKFVCAIGDGDGAIATEERFPTTTPAATLARALAFFRERAPAGGLRALGVGAFGPVDLQPASPTYGTITTTPKPGWRDVPVVAPLAQGLGVPVGFDTDVNAAALGEFRHGAAQGLDTFIYLTIGTGIGGGGMVGGRLLHGLIHPEMGHQLLPHDRARDPFDGVCPYHGDCFEGLASGPALAARWGDSAESLPPDHPAWPIQAHYIALALTNLTLTLSPQRIILGGGVMAQQHLFPLVRRGVTDLLGGYVHSPAVTDQIDAYIVPPALGVRAGIIGALALAQRADPGTP